MSKSLSRLLYLLGILVALVGVLILARGYAHSMPLPRGTTSPIHATSAVVGTIMCIVAGTLSLLAWLGALVRTAQLHRWGWFICLLLLSGITLLLYIFFGPTTFRYPSSYLNAPPYGGFGD